MTYPSFYDTYDPTRPTGYLALLIPASDTSMIARGVQEGDLVAFVRIFAKVYAEGVPDGHRWVLRARNMSGKAYAQAKAELLDTRSMDVLECLRASTAFDQGFAYVPKSAIRNREFDWPAVAA